MLPSAAIPTRPHILQHPSQCPHIVPARSPSDSPGSSRIAWFILIIAGLLEVGWAIGLKYTEGFTRLWPSIATLAGMVVSMYLLALAAKTLPIGTAYAVWTGIGAAGAAILGIVILKEPASAARIFFLVMLLAAIVGLKLTASPPARTDTQTAARTDAPSAPANAFESRTSEI